MREGVTLELSKDIVKTTVSKGFMLSRDEYRTIKGYSREQMTRYVLEVYKHGFGDGLDAVQKAVESNAAAKASEAAEDEDVEEVKMDWSDVLDVIATVKGVSADMIKDIDRTLKERF